MYSKHFLLTVLVGLFLAASLYPVRGQVGQGFDYVDSNTSNVDGATDIGSHGNFSAQQYRPDSIYDSLTEQNTAIGNNIVYENSAESFSSSGQSSHNFNFPLQNGSGNNRLVVVTVSWEDAQASASVSSLTFNGSDMTKITDVTVGTGYSEYIGLWYLLDATLPSSSGNYNVAVTVSESITREIYIAVAEYSGVKQSAPDDYDTDANTSPGNTAITLTAAADNSLVVAGVGEGSPKALTNTNNINNLQVEMLTSCGSALGHQTNVNSGSITVGWNNLGTREGMAGAVWQPAININYELDLEVQWTNATFDQPNEELAIFGGAMGSENIAVEVWNGTAWRNLFTDLSNGWNNISISNYLNALTFTIRFTGSIEIGDSSQDSWQIDSTLLHTWGTPPIANFSYTPTSPYTSEVITFNASASYDPDGSIVSYFWDFGDGANSTGEVTTHSYINDGTYTISLSVTDNDGLTSTSYDNVTVLNRPPASIFIESTETADTGVIISFNASSSYDPDGTITSYFWDFGDGLNGTGVTASHAFLDDGVYTVTLTVTDDDGATASTTGTKTILNRAPVASFTESAETVDTSDVIAFNASNSYDPDGTIVGFFWDFGDGTNTTGVTASHAYGDDGVFTVTLTITDDDGATSSVNASKTVLNQLPVATFTESATTILTNEILSLNASASYDPDGSIVGFFWDFGDGTNATGVTASHAYNDDGAYTVTLTITDDDGATASTNAIKTILNRVPVVLFTESAETVYTGETIYFNATTSYDPDGSIVSYFWDFGDGTNTTGILVEHVYSLNGTYTVTLTITDDDGASNSISSTKTILFNEPPVAVFTESAETVYTGETIYLNASDSYDLDGIVVSYFWDFGDDTNITGVTTAHAYANDGIYTVTLTVTDDRGATSSINATKTVLNRLPTASFTESAETVYTGEIITFNASSSYDPDGSIVGFFWDFGGGTNATGMIVTHSHADNGTYVVTLTVTDDDGAVASANATKTVLNRSPIVSFTESAETVYTGESIAFNASSSYDPDGIIATYFWDFGDGTNATGVIVAHTYVDDGSYTVTLTVTDDDGATSFAVASKTVLNRSPSVSFTESAETVYTDEIITFNASDSYDSDGSIVGFFWDFGDGTNATGIVVQHSYSEDGVFTVNLTVTDDDGAVSTATAIKTILNRLPVAVFTESVETVYTGEIITFNASASYDPDGTIISYFWDWGDGTNSTTATPYESHSYADDSIYIVTLTIIDDDGATASTNSAKTILNRLPSATFTESTETVYTGEIIYFNATTSYDPDGSIVSYFWDFGDGTNGTGTSVEHAYVDDGNYTVTLTVTDDDGATSFTTASKTVLNRSPTASFTEFAETVYTDEIITFNASDSYDSDGSIVGFFWDFGDGTNTSGVIVSHSYVEDGVYTVSLTVTDDDGAIASVNAAKTVLNQAPVVSFTESAETVYTGETIYFNASASYDPDGSIVSFFWDFGDGTNGTGTSVEHAYVDDGNYTVTLTVTDDDGATSFTTASKTVLNRSPSASFTESAESVFTGEVITFDAYASYDPDGIIVSYFWDFGDATNATGLTIGHAYADGGNYTVTLTVTDDDGATSSATTTKTVLNRSPTATFTTSATTVLTGEVITFEASSSHDSDGVIASYFWDFGDGTNATGMVVTHPYANDGIYVVTLTVTDDDGATGIATATIQVLNRSPVVSFTESAETVYTGEIITFNASASYDPDGSIVSYFWDFGDGTNATGMVVTHAFSENGTYTVTLTLTDDDGAADTAIAAKTVMNRSPVASFTESAETVLIDEVIYFNASSSYDPDGSIVSFFWDFGDSTNATGVTADHAYSSSGVYVATLIVTDNDGATATATAIKTVEVTPPVASFTESAETVLTDETIYFNASTSYDPDGYVASFFWDFGDGANATGVTTQHVYADDGNYTVTLTVTDNDDAPDTTTSIKTVVNRPPVASFTESAETVNTGEIITFNASASYDPDGSIVSYFWDFGDGANATGVIVDHAYSDDGNYTVTLTVTDDDNAADTAISTKTASNMSPVASFTESDETVLTSEVIYFNASTSFDPDGVIISYFWDFGDGSNTTGMAVQHAYAGVGSYTVTLTVTDEDGASDSVFSTKTILNRSPVASFTESAVTVYTGEIITFNASSSYDPDGSIVSYFWDFGDGTNATGVVVNHAYADDGTYTVTFTVTDNDGAATSSQAIKTALNRSPVASFTESATTVLTGEVITFNASSSYDPDGTVVGFFWDFGDGANATGVTASHAYVAEGAYTVTLTITDDDTATDTTIAIKNVGNSLPVAIFTESADTVFTGVVISFDASDSYDPDGTITSFLWNFGDGANATGISVGHAYSENGTYTVTLTVTDDDGATDITTSTKTILNRAPVASFIESATTVPTGTSIHFDASGSYDPDGVINDYFWDFGDGTNATGVATVDHAYADNGSYLVTLSLIDDDGASGTASATKTALNRSPVASFTESAETVYTNDIITFNASDSYDPDGSIVGFFWDFGDGTNASSIVAGHAYVDNGVYTVTLTITDDDGASSSSSVIKTVFNRSPQALFTESAESVIVGEAIYFNASASYDPDGSVVGYFWDFGDGSNATGVTSEHTYADIGVYTVNLTVTDDDGATTSTSSTKIVGVTPPVASFTESAVTVYTGEIITFNASSSYDPDGSIVGFFWDFGDSANTAGMVVTHAFSENGTYTVTLTLTDDDGVTAIATSTKTVLNRSPVALFTESDVTVYVGQPITFNASDSYDPDGTIIGYFWDFGDGTNATGITVEHTYSLNGTYTVTLTISDNDGAFQSASATKTILWNEQPVASFTESAETVYTWETVYFNASASYDPDGSIVGFFWDFGDSTNTTGAVVEHAYVDNGSYPVTLTVTDDVGAANIAIAVKTVQNNPPVALFTESAEVVYTGEVISFNASASYDLDGTIVSFFWGFGDGTNTTGITASHSYTDNGTYTVTLTVTDDDAAANSTTAIKTVLNNPPVPSFTESAETVFTNQSITFNASASYDPDGNITSFFWDFGDGTNATGITVEHTYSLNGTFTVTLNVTDNEGGSSTANATKTIIWNEPPVALFTESAQTVIQGEPIAFDASASYDNDGSIVSYFWDFGDGTNATGITVEHTYMDDGNYTVTLSVTDNIGETRSTSSIKTVLNMDPVPSFTESAATVYTSEMITFNASDSYDPDGSIASLIWDFGDGANATGIIVTHTFIEDGFYTVTLTVTDDDNSEASVSSIKTILNRSPVALFTSSPTGADTGEPITFNASDSYDPDGTIVSFIWDFGDDNTDYGEVVTHTYTDNGRYVVTLIVMDNDSAQKTATGNVLISNRPPAAIFAESTETSYVGTPIEFDASACYDPDGNIVSFFWDFGDGVNASGVSVDHAYAVDGTFTVTLTVSDDDGGSSIAQATKTILENQLPVASFIESAETVDTGEIVVFDASTSYDADGTIISYSWDFGDGLESTGVLVQHSFTDDGTYTVTLTVTDDRGAPNSVTATKTVLNRNPVPSFTESLETAYVGGNIEFNASASYDPDGTIVSYFWDFGDGANASGVSVDHAYAVDGTFTVTLTVTDDDGDSSIAQATKTIIGGVHDVAVITVDPSVREIFKHHILNVSVVVANEGAELETFNVTLYSSEIRGWHLVEVDECLLWFSDGESSSDFILTTSLAVPANNPILTFDTKYNIENLHDFGFVQISLDGGTSWISLENAYTTYEHADTDPNIISNLPGITGTSTGWPAWAPMTFNLSQYAGEDVLLGFRYMTDTGDPETGWHIDNITINGVIIPNQTFEQFNPPATIAIETIAVLNMFPGTQTTIIFSWNTSNTLSGRYSISAVASVVIGENNTRNNNYVNGPIEIKMNPDLDGDGDVDIFDVVIVTSLYGCREGEPCWNPRADSIEDGIIDIYDVVFVVSYYGKPLS